MTPSLLALLLAQAGAHPSGALHPPPPPPAHAAEAGGWQSFPGGEPPAQGQIVIDTRDYAQRVEAPREPTAVAVATRERAVETAPWLGNPTLPGFVPPAAEPEPAELAEPDPLERSDAWALPLASSPDAPLPPEASLPEPPQAAEPAIAPPPLAVQAPPAAPVDGYQAARWGLSQAEVAALFPEARREDHQVTVLQGRVSGENASTGFFFVDDRLVAVTVTFTDTHPRPGKYVALFGAVRQALSLKYGQPGAEKEDWEGEHFRLMDKGMAVVMGGLRLSSAWRTGQTGITLSCSGGGMKGRVQLTYASLELASLLRKEAERRQLEGL